MHKKFLPIFLIISAVFLFGCGLTDIFADEAEQAVDTIIDEVSSIALSETEEPPQPQATEPTEAVSNTEEVEASVEDSSTEDDSVISLTNASACYHPYFPISDGATWTFDDAESGGYTLEIAETEEDAFTMIQTLESEDTIFTVDWICSDEGLLRGSFGQVDLFSQAAGEEESEFEFETLIWEGETLPSPELMALGHTWTSEYQLAGEMDLESFAGTMEVTVSIDHEIGAIEEVTVPAGTFEEAVRVDSIGQIEMVMMMGEMSTPFSGTTFNYSTWYVEGIGMVKSSNDYAGALSVVELVDSSLIE